MWQCERCMSVFEYPEQIMTDYGYESECPECGNDDMSAVHRCTICDEWSNDTRYGACPECYERIQKRISDFVMDMTTEEVELFLDIVDAQDAKGL